MDSSSRIHRLPQGKERECPFCDGTLYLLVNPDQPAAYFCACCHYTEALLPLELGEEEPFG